jgi:ribosomal-protein-alanine N-acetyltransferase
MVTVRPARTLDFDRIYEIECQCFASPWLYEPFFEDFTLNPNSLWWVAIEDRKIIGFCGLWRQFDEMHIINVCVEPKFRRQGAGAQLVAAMLQRAEAENVKLLLLEVRATNIAAIKLYEAFGFRAMYTRKKYYQDNDEDAIVMVKER